jgi:ectoine hydroxylase-related dioxygenase (phytanoyl-CoA dioxygenase family)
MLLTDALGNGTELDPPALKARYDHCGYVAIRSIFSSDEVESWSAEADRLWHLPEVDDPRSSRVDWRTTIAGTRTAERLDPVTDISPVFQHLSTDQRLLTLAGYLLGEEAILFKDKLIIKPPGVNGYPLHQDFAYIEHFGFEGSQQLAVCIAIDATDVAAGPIEFFPFLHHRRLPSPPGRPGEADEAALDMDSGELLQMEPGDMVIFSSLCPHRSAPNRSGHCRRLLFLTYNARSSGDFYDSYYRTGKP